MGQSQIRSKHLFEQFFFASETSESILRVGFLLLPRDTQRRSRAIDQKRLWTGLSFTGSHVSLALFLKSFYFRSLWSEL